MLNDLTYAQLPSSTSQIERPLDQRGSKIVTTIKPTGSTPLEERAKPPERQNDRARKGVRSEADALQFRREETSLHRLYRSTRATVETARDEKIKELRQAVNNGTYRPNLMVVAERLLSFGELGRF